MLRQKYKVMERRDTRYIDMDRCTRRESGTETQNTTKQEKSKTR